MRSIRELDNVRRHKLVENGCRKVNSVTSSFENRTYPIQTLTNLTSIIVFSETRMQLTSQRHGGCGQVTQTLMETINVVQTALIRNVTRREIWDSVRNQLATRITLHLESERAERVLWHFKPAMLGAKWPFLRFSKSIDGTITTLRGTTQLGSNPTCAGQRDYRKNKKAKANFSLTVPTLGS